MLRLLQKRDQFVDAPKRARGLVNPIATLQFFLSPNCTTTRQGRSLTIPSVLIDGWFNEVDLLISNLAYRRGSVVHGAGVVGLDTKRPLLGSTFLFGA